jgi:hypothetical protein
MKPKPNLLLSSGAYRPMGKFRQMAANAEISPAEAVSSTRGRSRFWPFIVGVWDTALLLYHSREKSKSPFDALPHDPRRHLRQPMPQRWS